MSMDDQGPENGIDLKFWAKLGQNIADIADQGKRRERRWLQRANDAERDFPAIGSGTIAAGTTTLSFGMAGPTGNSGPEQGYVWVVRRLSIGPALVTTQNTATSLYIFQSPTDPLYSTSLSVVQLVAVFTGTIGYPAVQYFGNRQIVLRNPDALWGVVIGGTATQQWSGAAQIEQYTDGGYKGIVDL